MTESPLHRSTTWLTVTFFAMAACLFAGTAFAVDVDENLDADALQQQVERTAVAYDEAIETAQRADEALAANQERIAELEKELPLQQERSDAAARKLYKSQQQGLGLIDLLLGAEDFFCFLNSLDYANRITASNVAEISRLHDMQAELESKQAELEAAKQDADARALEAERALTAAQEARLEAQRKAQEAARQEAEAAAVAKAAAASASTPASGNAIVDPADAAVAAVGDEANWSEDEATFVSSWAARIDAYLEGSPLAGQGRTFAQAAWNYGVDPRWSPAISYTESSLGAACFLPHNAWGWGSSSWDSWEEAIDAHVRGLARGYGYTISPEAAQKYCPPTWDSWYNKTLAQMNMI